MDGITRESLPRILGFVAAVAMLASAGCSSAYRSQAPESFRPLVGVMIDSEPIGGLVRKNGIRVGTTPTLVSLEANEDGSLYNDVVISVDQRTNARAVDSTEVRAIQFRAGESLPSRVLFPLGEDPRYSGRALIRAN